MPRRTNMDLGIGKINLNIDLGMSKTNYGLLYTPPKRKGKPTTMKQDIQKLRDDYQFLKPYGKQVISFYGGAGKSAVKGVRTLRSRFAKKQYIVLTVEGGVTRPYRFSNINDAKRFREKQRAQGTVENISEVVEQRI